MRDVVEVLASDGFEGRGAGYEGEVRAALWIEERFRDLGLLPGMEASYRQPFSFLPTRPPAPGAVYRSQNLIGLVPGRDAQLAGEYVIVSAHFDGQGRVGQAEPGRHAALDGSRDDGIWNSANDNATGVAALLEVAREVVADPPRRSTLFIAFGAEEHACPGSTHFVTEPPIPLDSIHAVINLEQLGGWPGEPAIVSTTSTSPSWSGVLDVVGFTTGVSLRPSVPRIVADADHWPFAAAGVPAVTYGLRDTDTTHRATDEFSTVSFADLTARTEVLFELVRAVAEWDERFPFTGDLTRVTGLNTVQTTPLERLIAGVEDPSCGAFLVATVIPGTMAERLDFRVGDLVTHIDGVPLAANDWGIGLQYRALDAEAGARLECTLLRDGQRLSKVLLVGRGTDEPSDRSR